MNLTWADHLDAIAAAPDDDAPRLVCADWLMQRGDPRGEYIALCLDQLPTPEKLSRLAAVKAENDWLTPLLGEGAQSFNARVDGVPEFTRGFVESVGFFGRDVANLGAVLRREPITSLRLTSGGTGPLARAGSEPELKRVHTLRLDGRHTEGTAAVLAAPLDALRTLWMTNFTDADAQGAARGTGKPESFSAGARDLTTGAGLGAFLSRVTELSLTSVSSGVVTTLELPEVMHTLAFHQSPLSPAAMHALGPRLDHLSVFACTAFPTHATVPTLDRDSVRALITHVKSGRLVKLDLHGMSSPAFEELVCSPVMKGVHELDLSDGSLTADLARALMRSDWLGELRLLVVRENPLEVTSRLVLPGVSINDRRTELWD
ncbi:MAG: TIGR02996 domain-containing protein [Archangium sp.]|nr:TIGR02996 domain-containing protein [Archangium sp.]